MKPLPLPALGAKPLPPFGMSARSAGAAASEGKAQRDFCPSQTQSLSLHSAMRHQGWSVIRKLDMRGVQLVAAFLILVPAACFAAAGTERWAATSTTAMAITGDIILSPTRMIADGKTFPLAFVADVKNFSSNNGLQAARILRVTSASNPILKNSNRLCGSQPARWIAVYQSQQGKNLNLSVFSGTQQPSGETGPDVCGTFLYSR